MYKDKKSSGKSNDRVAVLSLSEATMSPEANCAFGSATWIADSGATFHMAYDRKMFTTLDEKRGGELITLADKVAHQVRLKSIGSIRVKA